ncbi:MAG: hypothetical protein N2C13_01710 [Chloroflexota bacterium]
MPTFYALTFLGTATILQTTIVSKINLFQGSVDLVMLIFLGWVLREEATGLWRWAITAGLVVGIASELPIWLPVVPYVLIASIITILKKRIWQLPIMSLFATTLIGIFLMLIIQWLYLILLGAPIGIESAFNLVILPSMLLNMLLVFPIYGIMGELFTRIYPHLEE